MIQSYSTTKACFALADGYVAHGVALGDRGEHDHRVAVGEVVFNTSMGGYQEIITDPSYAGQIVTFTAPHIGNVGCNSDDDEAAHVFTKGVIIRDYPRLFSNYRSEQSLHAWMQEREIVGISEIDTRDLVLHIRSSGAQMGAIGVGKSAVPELLIAEARRAGSMEGRNLVTEVSCKQSYAWNEGVFRRPKGYRSYNDEELVSRPHVVAIDCGVKRSILRGLVSAGFRITVVPSSTTEAELRSLHPDALFLSNGPGDPATVTDVIALTRSLLGRLPIFGICLGHQILALAVGAKTYKLPFGHRGGNHPVMDVAKKSIEITVQNHGFSVDERSLPRGVEVSHVNLNDKTIEGLTFGGKQAFSVQYHPEASPGPHDSHYLFRRFFERVVTPHA